jgi:DNA repair protein RecN (Recombination protein N)
VIEFLRIQDFALVNELTLELGRGFTVLSGETGAGKSILLQALGLLLGDRASRDTVRAGASQARVEGAFSPGSSARKTIMRLLDDAGIAWEDGESLLVARTVGADGRSRAHVNGALVPLSQLGRLGECLVEVSSQHQHQGLLREETHLALLDGSAGAEGAEALDAYREAYRVWAETDAEARRLESHGSEARERTEFLRFQAGEIRSAGLVPGELERLRAEREVLLHAGKLLEAYASAESEIYSGPEAALDRLGRAEHLVEPTVRKDPNAAGILELLAEARGSLDEAAHQLRERQAALDADPGRLEAVEDRLDVIRRLERKHGAGVEALLARLEEMERELWELENTDLAIEAARQARDRATRELGGRAETLRAVRESAARNLEAWVGAELEVLDLRRSSFQVELVAGDPGPRGSESARFLLAPNPGEPPRPLARIASGGELSRILLALKNALRDTSVETLIFDEVDAGVGGPTADAVGDRLAELARSCQVICITHMPQIASRAGQHFRVEKEVTGGRTVTRVRALDGTERVEELARMLGGRHVTETTRKHARELAERFSP